METESTVNTTSIAVDATKRVVVCLFNVNTMFGAGSVSSTHFNDEVAAHGLALALDDGVRGLEIRASAKNDFTLYTTIFLPYPLLAT